MTATAASASPPAAPGTHTAACAALGIVADETTRRRVSALLASSRFEVAAAADTLDSLLDRARANLDVVILAAVPDMLARGGPVERLRNLRPACSIVIVADGLDRALVRKALRAGVDGYVPESAIADVLDVTISAVLAGQIAVPRSISDRAAWAAFSLREREVLKLVAGGLTNSEIADRLYLSQSTVKSHLSSSFRKLGVSSRAEAAAAILDGENGLDGGLAPP